MSQMSGVGVYVTCAPPLTYLVDAPERKHWAGIGVPLVVDLPGNDRVQVVFLAVAIQVLKKKPEGHVSQICDRRLNSLE